MPAKDQSRSVIARCRQKTRPATMYRAAWRRKNAAHGASRGSDESRRASPRGAKEKLPAILPRAPLVLHTLGRWTCTTIQTVRGEMRRKEKKTSAEPGLQQSSVKIRAAQVKSASRTTHLAPAFLEFRRAIRTVTCNTFHRRPRLLPRTRNIRSSSSFQFLAHVRRHYRFIVHQPSADFGSRSRLVCT